MNPALVGAGMAAGKGVIKGDPMDKIIKDAVVGGATGYLGGQMMPTDVFGASTALNSTAGNSLNAGASLMGGTGTAVGSNIGAGTTSLLGSPVTPEYTPNVLMDSAYNAQIAPSDVYTGDLSMMENQKLGLDMSGMNSIGIDTPIGLNSTNPLPVTGGGYDSTLGAEQLNYQPDFNNITKSTAEELEAAQGGFEKPLYERAFDSVVGFAEKNPIEMAGLGLTAFGATKSSPKTKPDSSFARSAGVVKQAYSPTVSQMKIRRA